MATYYSTINNTNVIVSNRDEAPEVIAGGGDAKTEIHELEVSKPIDMLKKEEEQNQTCGTILDSTMEEELVSEMTDSV